MADIKGRKVVMFRCNIAPEGIGQKPQNAFHKNQFPKWDFEFIPQGLYVKANVAGPGQAPKYHEFIIPNANLQLLRLATPEEEEKYWPKPEKKSEPDHVGVQAKAALEAQAAATSSKDPQQLLETAAAASAADQAILPNDSKATAPETEVAAATTPARELPKDLAEKNPYRTKKADKEKAAA